MEFIVNKLLADKVLVSVVGEGKRVELEIVKDPTCRDGNLGDFYVTTFIKVDLSEITTSPCRCKNYSNHVKSIGRHPYLVEGEKVVSLNTGIPELDEVPVAIGADYARLYYYPYPGTNIKYNDGSYEITISNKRLKIVNGVKDFFFHKITTVPAEELAKDVEFSSMLVSDKVKAMLGESSIFNNNN